MYTAKIRIRRGGKKLRSFITRGMIGLGYGLVKTKKILLNEEAGVTPQDAMDALAVWIGREIIKEMLEQKMIGLKDPPDVMVRKMMDVMNIAEELEIGFGEDKVTISVRKCLICPRRVGGYDLGGDTACPIGGLICGAITYTSGKTPIITKNFLQTGELCNIEVTFK